MTGVALVAGASRGLGLLVSAELVARGHRVHGCARDRDELDRAERLVNGGEVGPRPSAAGDGTPPRGEFVGHVCDVADAEAVAAWVDGVRAAEGRIDVAIHVAGIIQVGPVESTTLGHFRAAIDTMLHGPVHLCLAVLPTMLEAGAGRIGVVSSVGGVVSVPHLLPYSVAKFGAVGLTEGLQAELSGTGAGAFLAQIERIVSGKPQTGFSVELSLDADAQRAAFEALDGLQGAVLAIEPKTGRILAMVSTPSERAISTIERTSDRSCGEVVMGMTNCRSIFRRFGLRRRRLMMDVWPVPKSSISMSIPIALMRSILLVAISSFSSRKMASTNSNATSPGLIGSCLRLSIR